jgi:hypothetical protein
MYWDSSALLKLYVDEPDGAPFVDLFYERKQTVFTSALAFVEILCALQRKGQEGAITKNACAALFDRFRREVSEGLVELLPLDSDVLEYLPFALARLSAARPPVCLRSLDAIHLSTALTSRQPILVAADRRLRAAARLMGVEVLP